MACELKVADAAKLVNGQLHGSTAVSFRGVGTDSREDLRGKLFIALKGENFDGHLFCDVAVQKGAVALIVGTDYQITEEILHKVAVIVVPSPLRALQDLATGWRRKIKAKVVGITGSNGKSTTKDFCYSLLKPFYDVHAAKKSFNNHIGVPLTILGASEATEVLLLEMGMNHAGELTELSKIAQPDVTLCTTVGRGHVGNFGGSVQSVASAKEEIYIANPNSIQIFNGDNEFTMEMFNRAVKARDPDKLKVFSSFSAGAEVSLRATHMHLDSLQVVGHIGGIKGEASVPVFGRHNVVNLMAASAVAYTLGILPEEIWKYLPECKSGWGRNQIHILPSGTKVLFDGYNANPDSVSALVKNMFEIPITDGKKVAILAEMLELGEDAGRLHEEIGALVGQTDFEVIWFFGPSAARFQQGVQASGFSKTLLVSDSYEDSLAKKVQDMLNPTDVVVIKGSRGSRVERVLRYWDPEFSTN